MEQSDTSIHDLAWLAGVGRATAYKYLAGDIAPHRSLVVLLGAWPHLPKAMRRRILERNRKETGSGSGDGYD